MQTQPTPTPTTPAGGAAPRRRWALWVRVLLGLFVGFWGVLLLLILALRMPYVQTRVVARLSALAYEKTGFDVQIGRVDLNFYDQLRLYNLVCYDQERRRMIEIPEATIDFALARLLRREVALDAILAQDGHVRIVNSRRRHEVNITRFVENLQNWLSPGTVRSKNPPNFYIYEAGVSNFRLSIEDERFAPLATDTLFDYRHIHLKGLTGTLADFRTRADTLELDLLGLRAQDAATGWKLHQLQGFFRMTRQDMTLAPMRLWVGNSYLADSVQFGYASKADLSDFVEKVTIRARLKGSRIDYRDLAYFAPTLRRMPDSVRVAHARVRGRVPDFTVTQLQAEFGRGSQVIGRGRMQGLPGWDTTRMDIALQPSYLEPEDLLKYTPAPAHIYLQRLGPTDVVGSFNGTVQAFTVDGGLYGRNGTLKTAAELHMHPNNRSTYSGTFMADNLALGTLLGQEKLLGRLTGTGSIKGKGFTLESARVDVAGHFDALELQGYRYRNLTADATLQRQLFDGYLRVQDSNLVAEVNGLADLSKPRKVFDLGLDLKKARLRPLGWAKREASLAGKLDLVGSGSNLDDAEGQLLIDSALVTVGKQQLPIAALALEARHSYSQGRYIRLASDYVDGTLRGDFTFSAIAQDLEAALNDYGRLFNNRKAMRNRTAVYTPDPYQASLNLSIQNLTPLLRLYVPGVQVARHATLTLDLAKTTNLLVQGDLQADYLAYGNSVFDAVKVDLSSSKTLDGRNVLAAASVTSSSQRFGNLLTKDLNLDGVWDGNTINYSAAIAQDNDSNYVDLDGTLAFAPGLLEARILRSKIRLLDTNWVVSPQNRLVYDGIRLQIDSLSFAAAGQQVQVQGLAGPTDQDTLRLTVDSLSAAFVRAFVAGHYKGKTSAWIEGTRLLAKGSTLAGKLRILNFERDGVGLGDIYARLVPQPADASLALQVRVDKDSGTMLQGGGYIRPAALENQLALDFTLQKAPIAYLEPLFVGLASNWQGQATGNLALTGSFTKPVLTGGTYIRRGGVTIDYLKTRYFFDDSVLFKPGLIVATGAVLRDAQGHRATLTKALVRHNYFTDWFIDLNGDVDGLQLLGTTYKDNKLYYGSAYGTGQMSIRGPVGDIVIGATLRTERGTRLFLPLQSALAANTRQSSFISFVNSAQLDAVRRDSLARVRTDSADAARDRVRSTGIRLTFNIEVTPDANGEIIFDKQTGDAVSAQGQGRIRLNIDTRGEFTMVGRLGLTAGTYKFTLANVIDKNFAILDGSSISWSGDPAQGILDIQARYAASVPFSPLLIGQLSNQPDSALIAAEARRRYPVAVNLTLTGPMLTPTIGLGLDIAPQYPSSLQRYVTSLQSLVQTNEQELNKQVFSLLVLRSFSPVGLNAFASAGSGVGNLTELLSNQLSSWLSDVSKNLEVGIDLAGFTQQALNNFQLRLSYTALDGRLRLTRNGTFTNTQSQTTATSLAGDWTLEYYLTRDGKLRLKAFHRTNQTLANNSLGLGNQYAITTQGVSILHTQSFSTLRELLPWLYRGGAARLRPGLPTAPETAPSTPANPVQSPGATPAAPANPLPPNQQPGAQPLPTAARRPNEG